VVLARTAQKRPPTFVAGPLGTRLRRMNRGICSTRRAARQIGEITALVQAIRPPYKVKRQLWPGLVTAGRNGWFGGRKQSKVTGVQES
jgi:hypothetical protein